MISSFAENPEALLTCLKVIGARFPMKDLGKLKFVLGVRVDYIPGGEMVLSQGAFAREVLKRFCAET